LRKSMARHGTILQTAMDGFVLVDMQGRLLEVNAAYCRMSGYSEQELLGLSISDLEARQTHTNSLTDQGLARGTLDSSLPFDDAWRYFPCHQSASTS